MPSSHEHMTRAELGRALDASVAEAAELRRTRDALATAERRVRELNAVLRAVRNINQLITKEKDPSRLLRGACRYLAETRGYLGAWAVVWNPDRSPALVAHAGLKISDRELLELYQKGAAFDCGGLAGDTRGVVRVIDDPAACAGCPIGQGLPPRVVLTTSLIHESRVMGELSVAVSSERDLDQDERALLLEVAGDLGFALHAIELEATNRDAMAMLRESEQRYRELCDNMSSGVAVYRAVEGGEDFVFVDFNRAGERIEKVRRDELIGRRLTEVFPGVKAFGLFSVLQRVYRTGKPERFPTRHYQDDRISGWRSNYVYRLPSGEVVAVYDDVTREREAEARLQDTITLYRTLVQTSPDATIMTDVDGLLTFVSPQAAVLFGYPEPDAMHGMAAVRLVVPEQRQEGLNAFDTVLEQGELRDFHLDCLRRDGSSFHGELSASLVRREDGTARGIIAVVRDISERRKAEEAIRRLNEELESRVKRRTAELEAANAELESFAYSVSHDLRSPLRSINFFCYVLNEDYGSDLPDEAREYVSRIADATRRMEGLIKALLELSRVTRVEIVREEVDLSGLAREIMDGFLLERGDRGVTVEIEPGLTVRGDHDLLRQLLQNLLGNAWKFTRHVPKPRIHFGARQTENGRVFFVQDNGAGFDMAHAGRLFQPFQRLHGETEFPGTGIGLATVKRIVGRHGGRVWAEAEVGKGATFLFTLEGSPT